MTSLSLLAGRTVIVCMLGNFLCFCCHLQTFFKINFFNFEKFLQVHYQSVNTPGRWQSKTPILLRNVDQKSIETVFLIAICRHTGDKWQSKTLFVLIFDPPWRLWLPPTRCGQAVWIQIRTDVISVWIRVQTVSKGYQHLTKLLLTRTKCWILAQNV